MGGLCVNLTQTGALICALAEEILSDVGFNFTFQTLNWDRTSWYITECWYTRFLHFIQATQIEVITDFARLEPFRDEDKFLMDRFASNFQGERLCRLNYM